MSIRRARSVLGAERYSYHYKARRRSQAAVSKRIKEIAETRVRYGYRRVHVLLRREGWEVDAKRVWRLYRACQEFRVREAFFISRLHGL